MPRKVLIAGENEDLCDLVAAFAEKEGFEVKIICDIRDDEQKMIRECTYYKPDVIFLSGSYSDEDDECLHTSLMADVYVFGDGDGENHLSLPVDISQLSAVLEKHRDKNDKSYIRFDSETMSIQTEGRTFVLDITEFDILKCFTENPNRVFSRSQLAYEVLGVDVPGGEKTVESAVSSLKEKIDGLSSTWSLKLLWGVGYKFEVL